MWMVTMSPTAAVSVFWPLRLIMAARRAPVLSATSRMERSWIMTKRVWVGRRASGLGGRGGGSLLGRDLSGDIAFADRDGIGGDRTLDHGDHAPALQAAERTGLHD